MTTPSEHLTAWGIPPIFHEILESGKVEQDVNAMALAKEWLTAERPFCVIAGNNGSGKTTFACQMLKAWASYQAKKTTEYIGARFIKTGILYQEWLDAVRNGGAYRLLMKIAELDVIVLDDIGVRKPAEGWREWMISLVDYRLDHLKRTIITTNLNSKDIAEQFGEIFLSRILVGTQIRIQGEDRRKKA